MPSIKNEIDKIDLEDPRLQARAADLLQQWFDDVHALPPDARPESVAVLLIACTGLLDSFEIAAQSVEKDAKKDRSEMN